MRHKDKHCRMWTEQNANLTWWSLIHTATGVESFDPFLTKTEVGDNLTTKLGQI